MIKITGFQDYIGMIQIKIMEGKSRKKKPLSDKKCRFSGLYRYRKKNMKKKTTWYEQYIPYNGTLIYNHIDI
jgi:hypothetical protein